MNRVTTAAMMAALLPFAAVPTAGAASLLPSGGATVLTHGPLEQAMPGNLQGALCPQSKPCTTVPYQPLIVLELPGTPVINLDTNIAELNEYIESPTIPGQKVVFAFSGGARDAYGWMQEHANDPEAPTPDDLSFVLIGNPTRKYGGINSITGGPVMNPVSEPYKVLDVAQQYDLISDFPQNPFNMLALANAWAGFVYLHLDYKDVDVDDPDNYVWTQGNVTYVFVPTENLPLLEPLRRDGMGWLADELNAPLKKIVEEGYNRSWLPSAPQGATPAIAPDDAGETISAQPKTPKVLSRFIRSASSAKSTDRVSDTTVTPTGSETTTDATDPPDDASTSASPLTAGVTHDGAPKHRAPRTALRDKLFGTSTKKAGLNRATKVTAKPAAMKAKETSGSATDDHTGE